MTAQGAMLTDPQWMRGLARDTEDYGRRRCDLGASLMHNAALAVFEPRQDSESVPLQGNTSVGDSEPD